jgi:hypothetical protein
MTQDLRVAMITGAAPGLGRQRLPAICWAWSKVVVSMLHWRRIRKLWNDSRQRWRSYFVECEPPMNHQHNLISKTVEQYDQIMVLIMLNRWHLDKQPLQPIILRRLWRSQYNGCVYVYASWIECDTTRFTLHNVASIADYLVFRGKYCLFCQ